MAIVLLDWEKAFDKVDHVRLIEALNRINIPRYLLTMISNIHDQPRVEVCTNEGNSKFFTQQCGIRQGRPLSPYLCILVMSVIVTAIKRETQHPNSNSQFQEYTLPKFFMRTRP